MKKFFALIISIAMVLSAVPAMAEEPAAVTVTVNGEAADFEQNVITLDNTLYIPLRAICSALELTPGWNNSQREATAKGSTLNVTVPIGKKYVKQDNMKSSVSAENIIVNDCTYMPLDALDVFDITYAYDEEARSLSLSVPLLNGKYFNIIHKATGKVMMPEDSSTGDGARIVLADPDGSDAQLFQFVTRGDNLYRPINQKSLRSIDMPNWRSDEGLGLIQYGNTEGTNQWVHPILQPDGTYKLIIHHSMMYLSVGEDDCIVQYSQEDDDAQNFILKEVIPDIPANDEAIPEVENADALSGKFISITNVGTGQLITTENHSQAPDAKIVFSEPENTDYDVWRMSRCEDGYIITNKSSSLALTSIGAGGNVRQDISCGSAKQVYITEEGPDGSVLMRNKASGYYLTESYGKLIETIKKDSSTQYFTMDSPSCNTENYEKNSLGGRYYTIKHASSGKVIGIPEDIINTNALLELVDDTGNDENVWAFISQGSGRYVISNKVSAKSFDVPNGKEDEGLEIIQYESNYGANQIYNPIALGDGTYRLQCQVSGLYLSVTENGTVAQFDLRDDSSQIFTLEDKGENDKKMIGAVAQLFLIRGEDNVTSAKIQWTAVAGATQYDIYRSVDNGDFEFLTSLSGQLTDDYDLELGREYRYAVYALEDGALIDYAVTEPVVPYELPADLKSSTNLDVSDVKRPNTLISNDGVYYHFQQWGIDGVPGFGRVMMQTSTDDVTYTDWKEVLNYQEILSHETCQSFTQCRFESVNFVYNKAADKFAFIAHFEADGGYGTAMISVATMSSDDERMVFHGAYRPEGDDCRDLNVFVDDDSSGYIIAAANNNANLGIYKLSDDWSDIEGRLCYVSMYKWRELPSVLKRDGVYYLFSSGTAGWYPTQGMVATASDMGGPWSELKYVGNTTTFSSQSGTMFTLHEGGDNHIMSTYRWMFGWQDATTKQTTNRRYPVSVSNGYAFYDFFDELLYNWENDVLVPVQTGRILSENVPVKTDDTEGYAAGNPANDSHYRTSWYRSENIWPFVWEADLGKVSKLTQLQISWLIWNGSEAYYNYILEASVDGENWSTVLDKSEGYTDYGFTCDNISGYGRYVRLTVLNAKPRSSDHNSYPAQIQEVKILGE